MSEQAGEMLEALWLYADTARHRVNDSCRSLEAWQLIFCSVSLTLAAVWTWDIVFDPRESLSNRLRHFFFRMLRRVPYVRRQVEKEIRKLEMTMEENFRKETRDMLYVQQLPAHGWSQEHILSEINKYKELAQVKWREGKCSGTVYSGEEVLTNLMTKVYGEFAWANPLHPEVFPDIRKMEAEVVRMACCMFNGDQNTCGTMTSGGTESIVLACKAYRDLALERGISHPQMVVPLTVHCAFDKAADYLRMKITHVPIDETTMKVNVAAMKRAITKNTCMLVGSAPHFPHGIIDPIEDIAKLGLRYNIPVHVDSCLGGFLLPFMRKAGYPLDPFDFGVEGVTSISADTHKYGFAPKGSSVILYRNKDYRKFQYFVQPDWPGGIYASPSFSGSRPGAIIAACWATLVYMGEEGYVESTRKIITTTRHILARLQEVKGIYVLGEPKVSVIGIGSHDFNIYRLSDALSAKGWNLNPLQFPSSIHLCVTLIHTKDGVADGFISDLEECVAEIMKDPKAKCGGQASDLE
ncbi:hypothetical protein NP493_386g02034 [Ridgeia piscesae]|uniref:sphinganine-1-phosphate aldolase n=1 Tax=Ridgeia piscesae TaxID=27915 RepID=A0AAD9L232_RIDPI|nr:hypothetical protein NP493_386g02034 [Ridgeia piscesae]